MYSLVRLNGCLVPSISYKVSSSASKTVNGKCNLHETLVALGGHESATSITSAPYSYLQLHGHMYTVSGGEQVAAAAVTPTVTQSITMHINVIINQCKPATQGPNYIFHSNASMAKSFPIIALSKHSSTRPQEEILAFIQIQCQATVTSSSLLLYFPQLNLFPSCSDHFQCLRKTFLAYVTCTPVLPDFISATLRYCN